eukprot:5616475-Prymnesium_polylepis.1
MPTASAYVSTHDRNEGASATCTAYCRHHAARFTCGGKIEQTVHKDNRHANLLLGIHHPHTCGPQSCDATASALCESPRLWMRRQTSKGGGGGHASQPAGSQCVAGAKKDPDSALRACGRTRVATDMAHSDLEPLSARPLKMPGDATRWR